MKRIILFFAFVLVFSQGIVFSQDYQTVVSSVTATFIGYDNQQVESIRIDSCVVFQGDSIFYPFYNIQTIDYECFLPFSYSWIGKKIIIKPDGYNYFINRKNDTIKINTLAQLNEQWIAYNMLDVVIIAEVIKHDTLFFLGQTDSVKTFSFTAYNQNMDPVFHPVNNKIITISKNYGILKAMNFSLLQDDELYYGIFLQTYDLLGISSPPIGTYNLTWKEIYDFDIGDEIHVVRCLNNYSESFCQEIKYIYLAKTVSNNFIDYSVERTMKEKTVFSNVEILHVHDTITMSYNENDYSFLDKLSGEIIDNIGILKEIRMKTGEVSQKRFSFAIIRYDWLEDSCWHVEPIPCQSPHSYLKGLGGPYYNCDHMGAHVDSRYLVYYKKGDTEWGTPLSINNIIKSNDNLVKIYPNPATDRLNVQFTENFNTEKITIVIYDKMGKCLYEKEHHLETIININISNLAPGCYFLRVSNKNTMFTNKFIKH